jgi:hypothetical protein
MLVTRALAGISMEVCMGETAQSLKTRLETLFTHDFDRFLLDTGNRKVLTRFGQELIGPYLARCALDARVLKTKADWIAACHDLSWELLADINLVREEDKEAARTLLQQWFEFPRYDGKSYGSVLPDEL